MKTLQELKDHLEKYNDAVIIVGPGIQKNTELEYTAEEFNENYTRKKFRREPEELWEFYLDKMFDSIDTADLNTYVSIRDLSKNAALIVDQNINSPLIKETDVVNLHGSIHQWICPKCKTIYTRDYVISEDKPVEKHCELCDSYIRPTALFVGERYDQADFDKVKDNLAKTHTLFIIGADYTEETILKLLSEYGLHKNDFNMKNEEEQKIIVCIQSKEEDFDPNEISFCEFLVKDDIQQAMERLLKGLE